MSMKKHTWKAAVSAVAICTAAALPSSAATVVWKSNAGGDLTEPTNWEGDALPGAGDTLDFSRITTSGFTLTGSFEDDRIFAGATFALANNNYVTLNGTLHFQSLKNANHLFVGSSGSLILEGNLEWERSTSKNENGIGRLLQQVDGTASIKGLAICRSGGANFTACYQTRSGSSAPLRVGGLQYASGGYTIAYYLPSYGGVSGRAASTWIVGSQGMSFTAGGSGSDAKNCYVVEGANSTLCSQADWSIGTSGNSRSVADIYIDGKTLTIDTKDYDDNTVPRTVTLNGRVYSKATSGTGLAITGNGTFVVATKVTTGSVKRTRILNTLSVSDTAALQINEDADYEIANISLAAGTALALTNSTADSFVTRTPAAVTLPSSGTVRLVIDGTPLSRGTYTLLSCVPANYSHFSVSGTAVDGMQCKLTDDGSSLQMIVGKNVVWKSNAGGDLTDPTNWEGDALPEAWDTLDFSRITTSGYTLTGAFGDDRIFYNAIFALTGNNFVVLNGSLHFQYLHNACRLLVASGSSLTVEKDIDWNRFTAPSGAENTIGRFLQGNNGTVVVKGRGVALSTGTDAWFYPTRDQPTTPMRVGGLDYQSGGYLMQFCLMSYGGASIGRKPASWIIGSKGLAFSVGGSSSNAKSCYSVEDAAATLYSQADWSIGTSRNSRSVADIHINNSTLTIDTKDYDDNTVPRTVTLNGRIYSENKSGTSLRVSGNGTFVLATKVSGCSINRTRVYNTWSIEDTATLQLNADAEYLVSNVTFAAGTTLSMPSSSATAFAAPKAAKSQLFPRITLPAEGVAYLRIDGPVLERGNYTVLDSVPTGYRQHLSVVGTALGGQPTRLKDDGTSLVLTIGLKGVMILVR